MMNKRVLFFLLFQSLFSNVSAQSEFYIEGEEIHIKAGALIYVEGDVVNVDQGPNVGRIYNSGDLQLEGNWENLSATSPVFNSLDSGTTTFLGGNGIQTIGGTNFTLFNNLTIDKTGVSEVRQLINAQNDGILNLTNDFLNTQSFSFEVKNRDASAIQRSGPIIPDFSSSLSEGYISSTPGSTGRLIRASVQGNTYLFPVGHPLGTRFRPLEITPLSGGQNAYSVQFVNTPTPAPNNLGPGIGAVLPDWYHIIDRQNPAAGTSERIRIYWDNANDNTCDPTTVTIAEDDLLLWQNTGAVNTVFNTFPTLSHTTNAAYPGTYPGADFVSNRFVLADHVYSPWGESCSLPIDLLSLRADPLKETILVSWKSNPEPNISGFDLLKSKDGVDFFFLKYFPLENNIHESQDFAFEDESVRFNQTYFYRLNQHELDGGSELTQIVNAEVFDPLSLMEIGNFFPNPSKGNNSLKIFAPHPTRVQIQIFNILGQRMFEKEMIHILEKGDNHLSFNFEGLISGNYLVLIHINREVFLRKFKIENFNQ